MSDVPFSRELICRLAGARQAAALTGAGVSAESGIPTFRDPDGLWEKFDPQELANVEAFLKNPELVQSWYAHRRSLAHEKEPNSGHRALAALEELVPSFTVVTQNVDNLHQRAGSRSVIELHGNITHSYCMDCGQTADEDDLVVLAEGEVATCPTCGGLIRPDVVWFGEMLPEGAMEAAHVAAAQADVFLSIGTSAVVYPAADLPLTAKEHGAYVAEINLEPSAISDAASEVITGKAGELLPRLVAAVRAEQQDD